MPRLIPIALIMALLPSPALAGPSPKRPICQATKAPLRDARRPEVCRKAPTIPWLVDPTPLFLLSTGASNATLSDLS